MGLIAFHEKLETVLTKHLEWVRQMQQSIRFAIDPIYIAYPPRQELLGVIPYRPSNGITAAFFDALRPYKNDLPPFLIFHNSSHGDWHFKVEPWTISQKAGPLDLAARKGMAMAIRRGPYTTELPWPLFSEESVALNEALIANNAPSHQYHRLRQHERWLLAIPSYMVTNSEIAALHQALNSDGGLVVDVFYGQMLIELVKRARERKKDFDSRLESSFINVAERIEGVVEVGERMFKFSGQSDNGTSGRKAWESFTEQTAPQTGTTWFADGRSIRE